MQYICNFLSKRQVPLIIQHLPEHPTLTVENWETWDKENTLYVVYNDGLVNSVLDESILNRQYKEIEKQFINQGGIFIDECINPHFVIALADELIFEIDSTSLDVIIGRWENINYKL